MTAQLKNNAVGYLAADISASDTGLILGSGEGNAFPTLTGAQYFYATLVSAAGTLEVVKVTARVGDALTVVRAQEGTIANGFATGARVELRVTAASIIDSAETGVYTPAGANAVQTTIQTKLRETVSVKDFGAVGDGVTDDTAAIQAALDAGGSVFFPAKQYKVTSTLNQSLVGQKLFGDFSRSTGIAAKIFLDAGSTDNVLMNIRGPSCTIESLVLSGKGRTAPSSYVIDANEEGYDSENNGDVDFYMINATLSDAETLIKITGRGFTADASNFTSFSKAIELDWPSTFVPGPNPDQKLKTGMRVYDIRNNRFHAGSSNYLITNIGTNAANLHGIQFSNNYIDTSTALFNGELHDSSFSNNVMIHSSTTALPLFTITGGSNFLINNNVFYGMDDNGAGTELEILSIASLANCVGCQINNNTINRVERDVVSISGTCSNISISNNIMRNVCLSNDGGTSRSPIRINAAIDSIQVKDNIIDLSELTPASWTKSEIIKNTAGYAVTNHDVRGNIFDSTYWNLHNFSDVYTAEISESDRRVIRYVGDGTASQTFTCAFKPMAVMAFNATTFESIMVGCFSSTGSSDVDISGYDVVVKSNFNASAQEFLLYIFQ